MSEPIGDLLQASPHLCPTPLDRGFYEEVARRLAAAPVAVEHRLDGFAGLAVDVPRGAALTITLLEGAQIVNAFAFNPADPDERMWQQSVLREGVFLRRFSRVWGTMARYRPLLTMLEDTVADDPHRSSAQHHPYYGGSGTPADWHAAGGAAGVPSTWEQFAGLLRARDVPVHILRENLCLFQRSAIDAERMRLEILPSNALAGDCVTLLAEIDLCVLLALSPYVDGGRPASTPGAPVPRAVAATVTAPISDPLPWPYPDVSYPDLSLYLDAAGTRSTAVESTPGIDYEVSRS
ncbi:MAG: DUF1989 domain-containing protein [Solirubrobacteraceae bacterium]